MEYATEVPHMIVYPNEVPLFKAWLENNRGAVLAELGEDGAAYLEYRIRGVLRQFEA